MRSDVARTLQVSSSTNNEEAPRLARNSTDVAAIFEVPAANVRALVEMGFEAEVAAKALLQTEDRSVAAALDVLSFPPPLEDGEDAEAGAAGPRMEEDGGVGEEGKRESWRSGAASRNARPTS
eukprot:2405178-Rhodomonas_salina.1